MNPANHFSVALLRSPLYRLAGKATILITYKGRRSGRHYSVPVQYAAGPDRCMVVLVGRPDAKNWWRNFRRRRPVTVRSKGRDVEGNAHIVDSDPDLLYELLQIYVAAFPKTLGDGRPAMLRKPLRSTEDELRTAAADKTFVVIEPDSA